MSTRSPAPVTPHNRSKRRLHVVGVILTSVTAVAALAAVNSASVGAASGPEPVAESRDPATAVYRTALGEPAEGAVDSLRHHAPELVDSTWCAAMAQHTGDWDGFAEKITTAADNWSSSEEGMFEFVGVVVQSVCADTARAFLASTHG